jgi:hypothetical protein
MLRLATRDRKSSTEGGFLADFWFAYGESTVTKERPRISDVAQCHRGQKTHEEAVISKIWGGHSRVIMFAVAGDTGYRLLRSSSELAVDGCPAGKHVRQAVNTRRNH